MQKILNKRERIILYLTIAITIFGVSLNFLIAPILLKNDTLNKEINVTRARLKRYLHLLSKKDEIDNKYKKFSTQIKESATEAGTLVNALSELENLAKDSNIRILDIRPQLTKNLNLYKETLIDVRTEGTMDGYLKFIYNLENSLSLLRIRKFQLNAKPNSPALEGSFSISRLSLD
jgi:hypothetical protein